MIREWYFSVVYSMASSAPCLEEMTNAMEAEGSAVGRRIAILAHQSLLALPACRRSPWSNI